MSYFLHVFYHYSIILFCQISISKMHLDGNAVYDTGDKGSSDILVLNFKLTIEDNHFFYYLLIWGVSAFLWCDFYQRIMLLPGLHTF